jgi:hypothetical protein
MKLNDRCVMKCQYSKTGLKKSTNMEIKIMVVLKKGQNSKEIEFSWSRRGWNVKARVAYRST